VRQDICLPDTNESKQEDAAQLARISSEP
jgi:hypothetical protein